MTPSSGPLSEDQVKVENEQRGRWLKMEARGIHGRREKRKALMWVYVIEWLVSSSALFISEFVLWTLIIRRRLYRAVRTTKFRDEIH